MEYVTYTQKDICTHTNTQDSICSGNGLFGALFKNARWGLRYGQKWGPSAFDSSLLPTLYLVSALCVCVGEGGALFACVSVWMRLSLEKRCESFSAKTGGAAARLDEKLKVVLIQTQMSKESKKGTLQGKENCFSLSVYVIGTLFLLILESFGPFNLKLWFKQLVFSHLKTLCRYTHVFSNWKT